MKLGINASRARSGGSIAHLVGVLSVVDPGEFGISEVHVWSYPKLLAALPDAKWLHRHSSRALGGSLAKQLLWERFVLPGALSAAGCTILLNVDAGSVCRFRPSVTMSRDMLSYEPGEMQRFGWNQARLRLIALRYVQNASLRAADEAVFLTSYAGRVIQRSCGALEHVTYIPHGVGEAFRQIVPQENWPADTSRPIRCLYVSNALPYKHQWHVVDAVERVRLSGIDMTLQLVGGGEGGAQQRLEQQIARSDPAGEWVTQHAFVPQDRLPEFLSSADLFVFASSCENMPNTLVEAMASGLPIACSRRGPMPEILEDGGMYFDPENPVELAGVLRDLVQQPELRRKLAARAKTLSDQYSWTRCARDTFACVKQTVSRVSGKRGLR